MRNEYLNAHEEKSSDVENSSYALRPTSSTSDNSSDAVVDQKKGKIGLGFGEWKARKERIGQIQSDLKFIEKPLNVSEWLAVGQCLKVIDNQEDIFRLWSKWSEGFHKGTECRLLWDFRFHPIKKCLINKLTKPTKRKLEKFDKKYNEDDNNVPWIQFNRDQKNSNMVKNIAFSYIHDLVFKRKKIISLKRALNSGLPPDSPELEVLSGLSNIDFSRNLMLQWRTKCGGPIPVFFCLEMQRVGGYKKFQEIYRDPPNKESECKYQFMVTQLVPNTLYVFRVCAYNAFGCSSYSQRTFCTDVMQTSAPFLVRASANALTMSWNYGPTESTDQQKKLQKTIAFGVEHFNFSNNVWTTVWKGKSSSVTIDDLCCVTVNKYRVYATNAYGKEGPRSDPTNMMTLLPPPSPPSFLLKTNPDGECMISVSWDNLENSAKNGKLSKTEPFLSWANPRKVETNNIALSQVLKRLGPDGRIHSSQISQVLSQLGVKIDEDQMIYVKKYFDVNERRARYITLNEFTTWFSSVSSFSSIEYCLFRNKRAKENERILCYRGKNCNSYQISGLLPNHTYSFSLKATSGLSYSIPSKAVLVHLPPAKPQKPIVIDVGSNKTILTSAPIVDISAMKMIIEMKNAKENNASLDSWRSVFTGDVGSLVKLNLTVPGTQYFLRCQYFNPKLEVTSPVYSAYSDELEIVTQDCRCTKARDTSSFQPVSGDELVVGDLITWHEKYLANNNGKIVVDHRGEITEVGSEEKQLRNDYFLVQREILGRLIQFTKSQYLARIEVERCMEFLGDQVIDRCHNERVNLNKLHGVIDRETNVLERIGCFRAPWLDEHRRSQMSPRN